jgi:anthranilate synthase / indole-3-glycerol phosphate synthase / phosphoribosylanthranilate isomerase
LINGTVSVEEQVKAYAMGGASVISVLCEPHWFRGSLDDLSTAAQTLDAIAEELATPRPALLLKDFIVDELQIAVARSRGADLVLLLVNVLRTEDEIKRMLNVTRQFGMEALVEVNTADEMLLAIRSGATLIGVNNRNLNTFQVDMNNTAKLASMVPPNCLLAALSGVT